jgi:hypothetical protein
VTLTRFDDKRVEGKYLIFDDKGKPTKTATTRTFAVTSQHNGSLLGYVKFFAQWRQYVFFPLNCILNKDCLREVADYCVEQTSAWREKRKAFPAPLEVPVVEVVS